MVGSRMAGIQRNMVNKVSAQARVNTFTHERKQLSFRPFCGLQAETL